MYLLNVNQIPTLPFLKNGKVESIKQPCLTKMAELIKEVLSALPTDFPTGCVIAPDLDRVVLLMPEGHYRSRRATPLEITLLVTELCLELDYEQLRILSTEQYFSLSDAVDYNTDVIVKLTMTELEIYSHERELRIPLIKH